MFRITPLQEAAVSGVYFVFTIWLSLGERPCLRLTVSSAKSVADFHRNMTAYAKYAKTDGGKLLNLRRQSLFILFSWIAEKLALRCHCVMIGRINSIYLIPYNFICSAGKTARIDKNIVNGL